LIRGIYTGAAALNLYELKQSVLANNLANIDTPGFKQDVFWIEGGEEAPIFRFLGGNTPQFLGYMNPAPQPGVMATTDFSPGRIEWTGNPLDLAIEGEGFFVVNVQGQELYTRAGNFTLDSEGRLVTLSGDPVQGKNGDIILPQGREVVIEEDGRIAVDGQFVDELRVMQFSDLSSLEKRGGNLFALREGALGGEEKEDVVLKQGFLERSNVDAIETMVSMIAALREYEITQRTVVSHDEALSRATTEIARLG